MKLATVSIWSLVWCPPTPMAILHKGTFVWLITTQPQRLEHSENHCHLILSRVIERVLSKNLQLVYKGWWMVPGKWWVSENLARSRNLGNVSTESRRLAFLLFGSEIAWVSGSDFQTKVSVSLRFYHLPLLLLYQLFIQVYLGCSIQWLHAVHMPEVLQ